MPNQFTERIPVMTRFWQHVRSTGSCWLWIGRNGTPVPYARVYTTRGKYLLAHRLSYEFHIGKIPDGLDIDHLCRTQACVNPAHLEPVTPAENQRRGMAFSGINYRKTHCPRGHVLTPRKRGTRMRRHCRICVAEQELRRYYSRQSGPKIK